MQLEFLFLQTKHIFTYLLFEQDDVFFIEQEFFFLRAGGPPSPPSDHYNKRSGRLRAESWELIGKYIITPSPQEGEEAEEET